jgi:hypothetical protein
MTSSDGITWTTRTATTTVLDIVWSPELGLFATAGTGIIWGLVKLMSKGKPSYTKLNFTGSSLVYTINQKK